MSAVTLGASAARFNPDAVDRLSRHVQGLIDSGALLGAQFALAADGQIGASASFGSATDEHRFVIFSATKPIVSAAIVALMASGAIDITRPVAHYLPEFASNGKHDVTVEQVMLMQGGFPQALIGLDQFVSSAGRREAFAAWALDWPAGTRCEYHPVTAHWVLAEIIETITGMPYATAIHEMVTAPAGITKVLGPEMADHAAVVEIRMRGEWPSHEALLSVYGTPECIPEMSIGADALLIMNLAMARAAGVPGGGGVARATDIAALYQSWLADPQLRDAMTNIRNNLTNETSKYPAHRTLLFEIAGDDDDQWRRWFPAHQPRTFGHHGAGGQICWADPDTGVSFCFLHDTLEQDVTCEVLRVREINELAAACVGR
ncbi:unannotated protein [freshwater metagenome]|uniref:Unannotated protein n=1 Tax=freshwater metagenome TaxID=449393 RepID=A0A6J7DMA5_9ZZZZ|nr:serine hydrolase [Actinomycetota bacterium]